MRRPEEYKISRNRLRRIENKSQISPDLGKRKEINPLDLQVEREKRGSDQGKSPSTRSGINPRSEKTNRQEKLLKEMAISMTRTAITQRQVIKEPKLPSQRDHKSPAKGKNLPESWNFL